MLVHPALYSGKERLSLLSVQGRVTISNDGATIMKLLEIVHPAAKVLVDISASQDAEVLHSRGPFTVSCGCLTAQLVIAQSCCIALLDKTRAGCNLLILVASAKERFPAYVRLYPSH